MVHGGLLSTPARSMSLESEINLGRDKVAGSAFVAEGLLLFCSPTFVSGDEEGIARQRRQKLPKAISVHYGRRGTERKYILSATCLLKHEEEDIHRTSATLTAQSAK